MLINTLARFIFIFININLCINDFSEPKTCYNVYIFFYFFYAKFMVVSSCFFRNYTRIASQIASTQSKTKCRVFIGYCGILQKIEEQCGGIFIADIYVKIFEDNVLNNFDKYFQTFFHRYL